MMMNLKRNGCLESIKGIVVGSMTKMKDNDIPWGKNAVQIIEDITKKLHYSDYLQFSCRTHTRQQSIDFR
jgi:muramoyltetrapeptide carboxypeptidase LdcA involved in peptidoglycan recycling